MIATMVLVQASAAVFAPPVDVPLRVVAERVQSGQRQYAMERLVRFTRDGAGYRAEIRVLRVASDSGDESGSLFQAGFSVFAGRTIVILLDDAGAVTGVEGLDALWQSFCAQVAEIAATRKSADPAVRKALAARIAGPLAALPEERRRALIGTLATGLIAEETAEQPGTRSVDLPGASPFGQPVRLAGTRVTTRLADGMTESVTRASAAGVAMETHRRFDPATGLLAEGSETVRTTVGSGAEARETVRTTTNRIERASLESWTAAAPASSPVL